MSQLVENIDAVVASVLDAQLARTGSTETLGAYIPLASGDVASRMMAAVGCDQSAAPDVWLRYLLRADSLQSINGQIAAGLAAYDATGMGASRRADAYAALGAAVVRLLLQATDELLLEELADGYHVQQALRRHRINKSAEEAAQ